MVEMNTPVCSTLGEVREVVRRSRRSLAEAAAREGLRIAAAGTHPFSHWRDQQVTDKLRYRTWPRTTSRCSASRWSSAATSTSASPTARQPSRR
jgi:gamma-glutamyl:cysteine ligase YbdK (ATP-grasp superfamily)